MNLLLQCNKFYSMKMLKQSVQGISSVIIFSVSLIQTEHSKLCEQKILCEGKKVKKVLFASTATLCKTFAANDNATSPPDPHRICIPVISGSLPNLFDVILRLT